MTKIPPLEDLLVISEEMLSYCANQMGLEEANSFKERLNAGREFKDVGLHPVYLCTPNFRDLYVTSEEFLKKMLH